ncbi:MAG: hypothetical protein KDD62_10335, partial [Bdellovibrionales bacterium]|nr:hypothetical protein [Bdellovibrionales bacterium]
PSDEEYFTNRVLSKFTSVIIQQDGKLIGHVAIKFDKRCSSEVQLIFPLLLPEAAHCISEIGQELTRLLLTLAQRQSWSNLSCLIPLSQVHVQEFLVNYCGAPVYGLCPGFIGTKNPSLPRHTGALFCHQFAHQQMQRKIFVSEQHLGIVRYLLEGSSFITVVAQDDDRNEAHPLHAERKSIERLSFPKTGITHSFVSPALLLNQPQGLRDLLTTESEAHFVLLDMEDPRCPELATQLETEGLRFCGIAPYVRNRYSMIYSRIPESVSLLDSCHAPRAQVLAHYIDSYNLPASLKAVSLSPISKKSITIMPQSARYDLN